MRFAIPCVMMGLSVGALGGILYAHVLVRAVESPEVTQAFAPPAVTWGTEERKWVVGFLRKYNYLGTEEPTDDDIDAADREYARDRSRLSEAHYVMYP